MSNNQILTPLEAIQIINFALISFGEMPMSKGRALATFGLEGDIFETAEELESYVRDYVMASEEAELHDDTPSLDVSDHNYEMNGWR